MSAHAPDFAALAHLLPEAVVGVVRAVEPISIGLSGAGVYAVSSSHGELVLRVSAARGEAAAWAQLRVDRGEAGAWAQQLRVLRRAAEHGVAPAIVHVDEAARAVVSRRVAGVPLAAALSDPRQREVAIASIVDRLRELHAVDPSDVAERDPIAYARAAYASQCIRPGYPAWAHGLDSTFDAVQTELVRDPRRVVSHNDVNPGNVLWDGARAWLVDWEVAGLAHPFYDLATLAMFLQLHDAAAHALLERLEQRSIDDMERSTFTALRRLVALMCGTVFLSMVPDLSVLPARPPTLGQFYAALRAGELDLQDARGQGAFALALLKLGTDDAAGA